MEEYRCEKYKNDPYADCHKDFCRCVATAMAEAKKRSRDRKVKASINFLTKNKIPFKLTEVENIVTTEYWGDLFYISLKTFKIRKEGSNVWLEKKKKLMKPKSNIEFGKHKGLTFEEAIQKDKEYFVWVNEKTDILLNRDLYGLIK